jgi:hypothetical protein
MVTTSDQTIYAPSGFGAQIVTLNLVNQTATDCPVTMTILRAGDALTDGIGYLFQETIKAIGTTPGVNRLTLSEINLDDGDSISIKSNGASNAVAITGVGWEYGASGVVLSGIQDDGIGDCAWASNVTQVDAKCDVGNGPNRALTAAMIVIHESGGVGYASYDTLGMNCGAGLTSMGTPKVSANFSQSSNINGSVHLFGLLGPVASTRHTVRGIASKAGQAMDIIVLPMSLTGVGSFAGFASDVPAGGAQTALNLPIATALGERVLWAAGCEQAPQGLKAIDGSSKNTGRIRQLDGSTSVAFAVPHFGILLDALGIAGTLTLTSRNTIYHTAVGMRCIPA